MATHEQTDEDWEDWGTGESAEQPVETSESSAGPPDTAAEDTAAADTAAADTTAADTAAADTAASEAADEDDEEEEQYPEQWWQEFRDLDESWAKRRRWW
jgi:hypothetical protein